METEPLWELWAELPPGGPELVALGVLAAEAAPAMIESLRAAGRRPRLVVGDPGDMEALKAAPFGSPRLALLLGMPLTEPLLSELRRLLRRGDRLLVEVSAAARDRDVKLLGDVGAFEVVREAETAGRLLILARPGA